MNGTLSKILMFVAGAAIGSSVTYKILEEKFKKELREEVDSVKEYYKGKSEPVETDENKDDDDSKYIEVEDEDMLKDDKETYARIANEEGYVNYAGVPVSRDKEVVGMDVRRPYVIPPETFGDIEDYDQITLFYFADGVLTDDVDIPIEDVEGLVGRDSLTHFGEYEDDSVFVRNDVRHTDIEILLDERNFYDLGKKYPHQTEDK